MNKLSIFCELTLILSMMAYPTFSQACTYDYECDDDNVCTDDICFEGECSYSYNSDPCDDELFCNGLDYCLDGSCSVHEGDPCPPEFTCDEENDKCVPTSPPTSTITSTITIKTTTITASTTTTATTTTIPDTDTDSDGIPDDEDNCPCHPNGPALGTCVKNVGGVMMSYRVGDSFITCADDNDCTETDGTCQKEQGDYNENGIGDACECYANFISDGNINSADLLDLQQSQCYGKTILLNPGCQEYDLNEDGRVSTWDYIILKLHYGRDDCDCGDGIPTTSTSAIPTTSISA